jgi:hypothetical protein
MQVSSQLHVMAAVPLGKEPPNIHYIGSWEGPRASLDAVEKKNLLHGCCKLAFEQCGGATNPTMSSLPTGCHNTKK